ncbi:MAG: 50S ribosomal protein L4 [Tissierellia bacterium]|nr:50S ribosomal protein L4 [Tissierellia bacterium]
MPKVNVLDMEGRTVSEMELNPSIFDIEINEHAVYEAVKNHLANRRQGTHSAKTRAEVRGGGRKPWRQKGTGRARQGSIRSPQWKGGGVVFAPKPRDYSYKLPKKIKRLALKSILTSKVHENEIIVVDDIKFEEPKTKDMVKFLNAINADKRTLLVIDGNDINVIKSASNIPYTATANVNAVTTYDIIKYNSLVITKAAIEKLEEVYS